jgi:hypothetical protein
MRSKRCRFIRAALVLALVLLSLASGPMLMAGNRAGRVEAHASGTMVHEQICRTVQRGTFGEVEDVYIWSVWPDASCDYPNLYTGFVNSGEKRSLIRFGLDFLPEGAVVQSATLGVRENYKGSGETINIYRITEPWSEGEPTWNNFASSYDDSVVWGSFVADGPGLITADVTELVSTWVGGEEDNYGLLLRSLGQTVDQYASSEVEYVSRRPWLQVCTIVNDDPIAVDDSAITNEDTPVDIEILVNDSDPDGDTLTVSSVAQPSNGSVTDHATHVTYTPAVNYCGGDSFSYTVSDGNGGMDTATVDVAVTCVNDAPVAVDDLATTNEDTPVAIDVLSNDTDVDGTLDPTTVSIVSGPSHGLARMDPASGAVAYSPSTGTAGSDSFTYTVNDDDGVTSNVATVTVRVRGAGANDRPVAVDDSVATSEDTPVVIYVLSNDTDADGTIDPATVSIIGGPSHGSGDVNPASGAVTYSPDAGYNGSDSFTYTVNDDDGATSNVATVTVRVTDVNGAPVAVDDSANTNENTPVDVAVLSNDFDPDGDSLTVSDYDATSAVGGTVGCSDAGVCTYDPPTDFNGTDTFHYTASDGNGGSDTATVTVEVVSSGVGPLVTQFYLPVVLNNAAVNLNAPPVAVDDKATTDEDTVVNINVLANDFDSDGDILIVSDHDATSAEGGTVMCTVVGVCTYDPPVGFNGTDTFQYTASDGNGGTDSATVTVEVSEPGSAPLSNKIYMPIILNPPARTFDTMPDFVVERVVVTSSNVQVTIRNQSDEPYYAFDVYTFRVDVYVAPDPVPTGVNQMWNDGRSAQGAVWYVPAMALSTEGGGEVTLTIGDDYYRPSLSNLPGSLPVGTPVYAQVDSANPGTAYGVVLENHEVAGGSYNNVRGPVFSTP